MTSSVVVITEVYRPQNTPTAWYMGDIVAQLRRNTNSLEVWCVSEQKNEASNELNNGGVDLCLSQVRASMSTRIARLCGLPKVVIQIVFTVDIFFRLVARSHSDIIAVTNPPFLVPVVMLAAKLRRHNVTVIVHDLFPQNLVPASVVRQESTLYAALLSLYRAAYRSCSGIVAIGADMKRRILDDGFADEENVCVIRNWPTLDSRETLTPESSSDKVRIIFAGNVGPMQGLDALVLRLIASNTELSGIELDVYGFGKKIDALSQLSLQCEWLQLLEPLDQATLATRFASYDVALVVLNEGMSGLGVPSKAYNYMAAAKPIIFVGPSDSEIADTIMQNGIGWAFGWDELPRLEKFLQCELGLLPADKLNEMGLRGRELTLGTLSKQSALQKYEKFIFKLRSEL